MRIQDLPVGANLHCVMKSLTPVGLHRDVHGQLSYRVTDISRTNRTKADQFTQFLGTVHSNNPTTSMLVMFLTPMRSSHNFMTEADSPSLKAYLPYSTFQTVHMIGPALPGKEGTPQNRRDAEWRYIKDSQVRFYRTSTKVIL